jgi:hypothetical protein
MRSRTPFRNEVQFIVSAAQHAGAIGAMSVASLLGDRACTVMGFDPKVDLPWPERCRQILWLSDQLEAMGYSVTFTQPHILRVSRGSSRCVGLPRTVSRFM